MKNDPLTLSQKAMDRYPKDRNEGLKPQGGGELPEKLGGSVRPTSQNPYPFNDQKLRFLLPYS